MIAKPAVMSWSSGKDCTLALHRARHDPALEIVALLATFNETAGRVAIHGTRRDIARAQAEALGLDLIEVDLPSPCPNAEYEARIGAAALRLRDQGVRDWVFGDLFLDDIRSYREASLAPYGLSAHFPLWGADSAQLAQEMLEIGIDARVVTLDPRLLPADLCGSAFDRAFLDSLPPGIDPCGERGEFHTVVADGPGFARPLNLARGETVERDGFVYTDFTLT
ncbi:ATP-binding protein [Paracoccus sp. Z118]|uniref:Dph6-related ATP pyrophosphatase n=1 Tax=Paracoccus sp. Z118 TaxID=2851017 RepID=UPI001C2C83C1|nr:ATP-binding protein [Paracoccus sp. Z118]MBV0891496.1 ATP-binding protein [Paracoccus sp. Z118]